MRIVWGVALSISAVIPTYCRDAVLTQTLRHLFSCEPPPDAILVVDQTGRHDDETQTALNEWQAAGRIQWIHLEQPSITRAMNTGLKAARTELVLFLDDDIVPTPTLFRAHQLAHNSDDQILAVVGQVLQPGEVPRDIVRPSANGGLLADLDFPFCSVRRDWVQNVMAGNLSVNRREAIRIGGFDENFEGAAYRFETEFARRVVQSGAKVLFEPEAGIRHLRVATGGTRVKGSHLTSMSPHHGVGDYYFAMRCGGSASAVRYMVQRPFREVATRFHLTHPWWVLPKLVGEVRAFFSALHKFASGPRRLS